MNTAARTTKSIYLLAFFLRHNSSHYPWLRKLEVQPVSQRLLKSYLRLCIVIYTGDVTWPGSTTQVSGGPGDGPRLTHLPASGPVY